MSNKPQNEYTPDTGTYPGSYIQEKLDELGMTQAELASRIGRTKKMVNEIIAGKAPIEPQTAIHLERVFGIPAHLWNNLERGYRDSLVRAEERVRLSAHVERLKEFPVSAMRKLGWIPERKVDKIATLTSLLSFFGVASVEALDEIDTHLCTSFRQSAIHLVNRVAVLAWLRKGELEARKVNTAPFDRDQFRAALSRIRPLTRLPIAAAIHEATKLCSAAGVAIAFVPEIPGTVASGATRWLTPGKALIQFSLRGKTDDQFWFTLFHEAGHILLHPKKDIYIELDKTIDSREMEADAFAAETLIPFNLWKLLHFTRPRSAQEVELFAETSGLAPGIIVGRMQKEGLLPWTHLNRLKTKLDFSKIQLN